MWRRSSQFVQHIVTYYYVLPSPYGRRCYIPDNKVHGANMGPTWVLSAPGGPHVGPMILASRDYNVISIWLSPYPVSSLLISHSLYFRWAWGAFFEVMNCVTVKNINNQILILDYNKSLSSSMYLKGNHIIDSLVACWRCTKNYIPSSAVITRSNITWYCTHHRWNWSSISTRGWTHKRHPIARPNRKSYGMSFVNILEKINRVITAPGCTLLRFI